MDRVNKRLGPQVIIELILAAGAWINGVYLFSPWFEYSVTSNKTTALVASLSSIEIFHACGAIYLASAMLTFVGISLRDIGLRRVGLFGNAMVRLYLVMASWIGVGLIPFTWLYNLMLLSIGLVLWWNLKGRERRVKS